MQINAQTFLDAAPTYGTIESFLTTLRALDSSVPKDTTTQEAQPGNVGWEMVGWNNHDLNSVQVSSQYFWNQAASLFGAPTTVATMPPTQSAPVAQVVTQSQDTSTQSPSVVQKALPPIQAVNTTNVSTPTGVLSTGSVGTNATTTTPPSGSSDLIIGGFDVTTALSAVDPYVGIPYIAWAGIAVVGLWMFMGSEGGRHRGRY